MTLLSPKDVKSIKQHADRFQKSAKRSSILSRYGQLARYSGCADVMRHACHVCAWVSQLPVELTSSRCGSSAIPSAVQLLTQLLQRIGKAPLTHRLRILLGYVRIQTSKVLGNLELDTSIRSQWAALQRSLSQHHVIGENKCAQKSTMQNTSTHRCATERSGSVKKIASATSLVPRSSTKRKLPVSNESLMSHKTRIKIDKQRRDFGCLSSLEMHGLINTLESQAADAVANWDATNACRLVRKAVAWLCASFENLNSKPGADSLAAVSVVQSRLLRAILRLTDILDFSDEATRKRMHGIFARLQDLLTSKRDSTIGRSSRKWNRVAKLAGSICTTSCPKLEREETFAAKRKIRGIIDDKVYDCAGSAVDAILSTSDITPGTEVEFASTNRTTTYTLTLSRQPPPHWYCSCPHWKFQTLHPRERWCKHLQGLILENDIAAYRRRI
eukprot:TRINITY_DN39644_c0_g1_i1.p1 TRINITY_DN39644_c0_g1~~TRINITY_DN39644_c0_g1_i1.p1  ORF type:complete len:461 (-),score=52.98 TRINITY_DN39644_c0_g1_i1:146-1477(-)